MQPITLSYAAPGFTPPPGATFTLHERPDGVTFERPLPSRQVDKIALLVLAGMAVFAAALIVGRAVTDKHPGEMAGGAAVAVKLALGFAAACLASVPATGPRVQTIELVGRDLFVTNGSRTRPNRRRRYPAVDACSCSYPGTDVGTLRTVASLCVGRGLLSRTVVVADVPLAECRWVANVLQALLERSGATA